MVHMPPIIVAQVTERLLVAYGDQRGGGRFDHFRAQIEAALGRLYRGGASVAVERILIRGLTNPAAHVIGEIYRRGLSMRSALHNPPSSRRHGAVVIGGDLWGPAAREEASVT